MEEGKKEKKKKKKKDKDKDRDKDKDEYHESNEEERKKEKKKKKKKDKDKDKEPAVWKKKKDFWGRPCFEFLSLINEKDLLDSYGWNFLDFCVVKRTCNSRAVATFIRAFLEPQADDQNATHEFQHEQGCPPNL